MNKQRIGVIADTHGLLRPEAIDALKGSSLIIHAGDIGKPEILEALNHLAPVVAVRGNVDKEPWSQSLPLTQVVEVGQTWLYVIHELSSLDIDPSAAGFGCVIFGHSHKPSLETHNGVIFLNPGSAGPRRFKLPISVAVIDVKENVLKPRLVELATKS
jgi:putative phosphoesterase